MKELSRCVTLIALTAILLASSLSMAQTRFDSLAPTRTVRAGSVIQSPRILSAMESSSNGILINGKPVPPMPIQVGCYEYTSDIWLSVACEPTEQAASGLKPTEGGNSGVIGVAQHDRSNYGVISDGSVKVSFSLFNGELDTSNQQCDSFSIQTNTNFFPGNNGDTDWVQFVEQSVNCVLIFAHFCIWQVDVTTQQYPNKCVFTNIQGLSTSYYASSEGYLSRSGGVNYYLNGVFCDNSNTCWGVVDTDNNGLTNRWYDTSGTILSYGNRGTAQFGSVADLHTYVHVDSSAPFAGDVANLVVTGEMNNLYPYTPALSCGSNPTTYYCDMTTESSTTAPCPPPCGGGSVAPGTLITMSDGNQVSVQNLREGMQLLSYDLISHQYVASTITNLLTVETHNQMVISTGTGSPLIVDQNPVQKLYVRQSDGTVTLVPVTDLRVGNQVFDPLSQTWVPITGLHYQNEGAHLMYDISCTVPSNYIANGYLVPDK